MVAYPDSKLPDPEETGLEFQDFVQTQLMKRFGIPLQFYTSRSYQYNVGETVQGVEIKYDDWCSRTERVSVEIREKTRAANSQWVSSGIYRKDNTWLYVQGNYDICFAFAKTTLVRLYETGRYPVEEKPKVSPTIQTFYLPFADAYRYAAFYVDFRAATP